MNDVNFLTTLPGLTDLWGENTKNLTRGDDPEPKGELGCKSITEIPCTKYSSNFINAYTSPNAITTTVNPYVIVSQIQTERLPMSNEFYLYITGGNSCISTAPPIWNEEKKCLWHAKGSRVLSIVGEYGLSCLIRPYIGSDLDIIYTYLTINESNIYATALGSSEGLCTTKGSVKAKEDLIHRNRKK